GDLEALGEVACVEGRARLVWLGSEADLVVGDEVDRAAGLVAGQPREVERLGDDALAREGCVAMNDNGPGGVRVLYRRAGSVAFVLRRTSEALDDGIDKLQV